MEEDNLPPKPDEVLSDPESKDWTISELYNKSFKIVKSNPILWIFGLTVAGAGGLDFSNISRVFDSDSAQEPITQLLQSDVLGASVSNVGTGIWIILGIEIVAFIILALTISVIYSAWANGSLINGIEDTLAGKKATIKDSSEKSFKSINSLAWLQIVPGLALGLVGLGVFGGLGVLATATHGIAQAFLIILIFLITLIFLYFLIYLALSQIWASRMVVLDMKGGKEALVAGYHIAKKKKWPMIGLGLVNTIASMMVVLVPIAILGLLVFLGIMLAKSVTVLSTILITLAITLGIVAAIGLMLLGGIITAFKASTWTIAYKNIRGKYE